MENMDVEAILAKLDMSRQLVQLTIVPLQSAQTKLPDVNLTIKQAHELIHHLKKMVEAYETVRPYIAGMQVVDED